MKAHSTENQAQSLGAFLRALRERQTPAEHGLVNGQRRRTPGLIDGPAYILDRAWTARRWNAKAARLFAGWLDTGGDRNLLRYLFLRLEARTLISDWEERARRFAGLHFQRL